MGRQRIRAMEQRRAVLERILALLLALAALAERAALAPPANRRQVLVYVACGEAVARGFLLDLAAGRPASAEPVVDATFPLGDDPALLAASLRVLALALLTLLDEAAAPAPLSSARPPAGVPGGWHTAPGAARPAAIRRAARGPPEAQLVEASAWNTPTPNRYPQGGGSGYACAQLPFSPCGVRRTGAKRPGRCPAGADEGCCEE